MKISRNATLVVCLLTLLILFVGGTYPSQPITAGTLRRGASVTTIASGLHNPRGLSFGPGGLLYVAEAGAAGTPTAHCGVMGDGMTKCSANTGSITQIDPATHHSEVVVKNLPSLIAPNGTANAATGIHDVAFYPGSSIGFATIGFGGNPKLRDSEFGPDGDHFARLGRFDRNANFFFGEDPGAHEFLKNPDGLAIDTNPYGFILTDETVVYTDAGGNSLNEISKDGIATLAVFPNRTVPLPSPFPPGSTVTLQAVPTSVAVGPDGDYYVGQLTGAPFQVGAAIVYRVSAAGGTPVPVYTGFTNIIDLAFSSDGSLYVLEIAQNAIPNFGSGGRLVQISPSGIRTTILAGPPMIAPGGLAFGSDGALYMTVNSTSPTAGAVWRVDLGS